MPGLRKIMLQRQRLVAGSQGVIRAVIIEQDLAAADPCSGQSRIQRQGSVNSHRSLFETSQSVKGVTAADPGASELWLHRQCLIKGGKSGLKRIELGQGPSFIKKSVGEF